MAFSEIPPPPTTYPGEDLPELRTRPPGPQSRTWSLRMQHRSAPMGPAPKRAARLAGGSIVMASAQGSNVLDVDGNRYVDLAAGFGALLVGHSHPNVLRAIELQSQRLLQALGDLYPADAKIGLLERLCEIAPIADGQAILGQSGADALSAALKTAALYTGRSGVIAFSGAYHGLSYGPLALCGLRPSYRTPFSEQLNPAVRFAPYPDATPEASQASLNAVETLLKKEPIGAIVVEPILGRGGIVVPPPDFLPELQRRAHAAGALLIADEIWTGLGRAGSWTICGELGLEPDLICFGKGLGGGLPISGCVGRREIMQTWQRTEEVVHTSTFAGAPLACASALSTLDLLSRKHLIERARQLGQSFLEKLQNLRAPQLKAVRGRGLMIGIELPQAGQAAVLQQRLLEQGYIVSTGGGERDVIVLTPPLTIREALLDHFLASLETTLGDWS